MTKCTGVGRGNNSASWGNHKSGSDHHRWNTGRILNEDGYVKVRVGADHPLADQNGYEALKRDCCMDQESAQAIRNAQYQSISTTAHIALGTIKGPVT